MCCVSFCLDLSRGLDEDLRKMRESYNKLRKEYDQARQKLKFFEKVGNMLTYCTYVRVVMMNSVPS